MIDEETIVNLGEVGKIVSFFQELDKIPRSSGNEHRVVNYLKTFAENRGLEYYTDNFRNIIIKKKATNGKNNYIAFQSHMDMVCEKIESSNHNFSTDPISLNINDDYIEATETNIGADNGIGVSYMLTLLDSNNIEHPNLEMIFTSEEETNMNGAKNIDFSHLISNRIISLDAFSENIITCGCASNLSRVLQFDTSQSTIPDLANKSTYQITIDGFLRRSFWKRYWRR